ncbi:MAG: FtsX-like permease family protein [Alphaproteobacteria bacterium]
MSRVAQIMRLALSDLRRDGALAVCQIFALAAVLTPLLVLFGLKQGVIGQLIRDLEANPAMREIGPLVTGTNRFDAAWLAAARARADVAFVVGDARALAAEVEATPAGDPDRSPVEAVLVPTGAGDPLAPAAGGAWASGYDRVALSFGAARALGVGPGGRVELLVPRTRAGVDEAQRLVATVSAVLPPERMTETRRAILASEELVFDVQLYRDGYAVPALGWSGKVPPEGPRRYERFRLYARTIDDVGPITEWLSGQGIEPVSRLEDIAPIRALDRNLSIILAVIIAFAAAGFVVALAATQWSSVERKRRELALLAVIGYGRPWLMALPLVQAFVLALLGSLAALALFLGAAAVINLRFPLVGAVSDACRLSAAEAGLFAGATCVMAVVAAMLAALRVTRIELAATIRDT